MALFGMGPIVLLVFSLSLAVLLIVLILLFVSIKRVLQKEADKIAKDRNWAYLKSLEELEHEINDNNLESVMESLHNLIKSFFREYLNIMYEITYEEIITELSNQEKGNIIDFLRRFESLRYENTKLNKKDLRNIINHFKIILSDNKIRPPKKEVTEEGKIKNFYLGFKNKKIQEQEVQKERILNEISELEKKYFEWKKNGYDVSPLKQHILFLKTKNQELLGQQPIKTE